MQARQRSMGMCYVALAALLQSMLFTGGLHAQETLPAQAAGKGNYTKLHDAPLSEITVDIAPKSPEGEPVASSDLPDSIWALAGLEGPATFVGCVAGSCRWDANCLLQIARFRHRYIYFEDEELERCGETRCLQCVRSPVRFLGEVAIMPLKMIMHCQECVRTPTPHVCAADSCVCGP